MASLWNMLKDYSKVYSGSDAEKKKFAETYLPTVSSFIDNGGSVHNTSDLVASGILSDAGSAEIVEGYSVNDYVSDFASAYVDFASIGVASVLSDSVVSEILNEVDSSEDETMQEVHKADLSAVGLIALVLLPVVSFII